MSESALARLAALNERILTELAELREQIAQCRTILERMLLELEKFNRQ